MRKLLLAALLVLWPAFASAQCTGIFPNNTLCGNISGAPAPPGQVPIPGTVVIGPGTSTNNGLPLWNGTTGTTLKDGSGQTIAGTYTWSGANTWNATVNFASTFQINGNTVTWPASTGAVPFVGTANTWTNTNNFTGTFQINGTTLTLPVSFNNGGRIPQYGFENCTLTASVASNLLTVALKDNAGSDPSATSPCNLFYRNVNAALGSWTQVAQTSALSINTNATGATLGSSNNTAFRIWVVVFNNSGTNVMALYNASTATECFPLDEYNFNIASTGISGSATSAGVFYTPNGTTVSTKAFIVLGYVEYNSTGLATAGTYATAPNFVQSLGPGVHKPCEVVREKYVTVNAATNFTGTSAGASTTTGLSGSIVPTSAANLIVVQGGGRMDISGNAVANAQWGRTSNANLFGNLAATFAGAAAASTAFAFGYDKPNTTSSVTYTLFGWVSSLTGTFGTGPTQSAMSMKEIMG